MQAAKLLQQVLPHAVTEAALRGRALRRAGHRVPLWSGFATWIATANLDKLPPGLLAGDVTAVDVGGHMGEWTAALLRLPQVTRVVIVEPTPSSAAAVQRRFATDSRVTVAPVAVGAEEGSMTLRLTTQPNFNSGLPLSSEINSMYRGVEETGTVDVPQTTLDDLLADVPTITLLKIDVQGYEPQVLAGATAVLSRTKCIQIECNFRSHYDGDASVWELNALLMRAGFHLFRLGPPVHARDGSLLWADAVYVRDDHRPGPTADALAG